MTDATANAQALEFAANTILERSDWDTVFVSCTKYDPATRTTHNCEFWLGNLYAINGRLAVFLDEEAVVRYGEDE